MSTQTKSIAKQKAETLKKTLEELGHNIGIRHCYEVIARQNGYESWNSMSNRLEGQRKALVGAIPTDSYKVTPDDALPVFSKAKLKVTFEGRNTYEFEVAANAKVKRTFVVGGNSPGHAYTNLEKYIEENEAEVLSGEGWEVDANIGQAKLWDIDLGYSSGLHKHRNLAPVAINPIDESQEEIENETGISWQSVQVDGPAPKEENKEWTPHLAESAVQKLSMLAEGKLKIGKDETYKNLDDWFTDFFPDLHWDGEFKKDIEYIRSHISYSGIRQKINEMFRREGRPADLDEILGVLD